MIAVIPHRRLLVFLAGVAFAVTAWAAPSTAQDSTEADHVVLVGALAPGAEQKMHQFYDFFPRDLQVHQGDTVRWESPSFHFDQAFHTVTFTPDPEGLLPLRDDELPGTVAFNEPAFFNTGCGRAGQEPCELSDPTEHVNSGTPILHLDEEEAIEPFSARIDYPPGVYRYVCALHYPVMEGTVEVVPDDVPLNNPSAEELEALVTAESAAAHELEAERSRPTYVEEGGRRIWLATAGARTRDRGGVGVVGFMPASLEIAAGDTVRWTDEDEAHSVTFPGASEVPIMFSANCESDEPDAGLPGVPLLGLLPVTGNGACPPGWTFEITINELGRPQPAPGNAVASPATWHHSGFMSPTDQRGHWDAPTVFEATFPVPGEFTYRCYVHPEVMTGSVIVR
jgi:plastocyanin